MYPELVGVIGSRVPDYRGRFLRGLQSGHSVGQTVANSIKSHNHTQPTHTHSFSGQLVSTALSGTAAGQRYSSTASLSVSGTAAGQRYLDRRMESARSPISGSGGGTAAATYGGEGVNYFFSADNRGIFLRGHGSQTSTHYGTVTHSSAALGQLQGDAIREIWGSFPEMIAPGSSPLTHGALYYGSPWAYGAHIQQGTAGWMKRSADFLASRVIPVAQEIRPVNRAVRYFLILKRKRDGKCAHTYRPIARGLFRDSPSRNSDSHRTAPNSFSHC